MASPDQIKHYIPSSTFHTLEQSTEGQAITCLKAIETLAMDTPVLIGACDNGMTYNSALFHTKTEENDCIVFTFKGHDSVLENPSAYGWVDIDSDEQIQRIGKKTISDNH